MNQTLTPLRGKLLVEVMPDTKRTESGLYLAENIKEIPHRARVVSLGLPYMDSKGREQAWGIQPGHIVHFKRNWDGGRETHYILRRDMIYAVECEGKMYAIQDYVIIRRVYTGKISNSTLVLPEMDAVKSNLEDYYGEVISVGLENKQGVSVGDKLIYHRNEGLEVKISTSEKYYSLKPRAILARII